MLVLGAARLQKGLCFFHPVQQPLGVAVFALDCLATVSQVFSGLRFFGGRKLDFVFELLQIFRGRITTRAHAVDFFFGARDASFRAGERSLERFQFFVPLRQLPANPAQFFG